MLERGHNYKVVEVTRQSANKSGQPVETVGRYTVIGAGMHRLDASGTWVESQPSVAAYEQGFVFSGAAHRLILNKNLNTAGSVDYQASDGGRIVSHPLSIYYYDPDSDRTVKIGSLKDCVGEITGSNQVTYADCFSGPVGRVSITFTYTRYGLHQDLTFLERPPSPESFGLGPNSRIETATELLDFPTPDKTVPVVNADSTGVVDETISFGSTRLTLGFAFPSEAKGRMGIPVTKQMTKIEGRSLILESLPWKDAEEELRKLPQASEQAALGKPEPSSIRELPPALMAHNGHHEENNGLRGDFESRLAAVTKSGNLQVAALSFDATAQESATGFVMDPVYLDSSLQNYTFLSGETYVVDGYVHADNPTFQSGAIFKSEPGANFTISGQVNGPGSGASVVFTSVDDDSIGFDIDGQPGMPVTRNAQYALALFYTPAMYLPFSVDIRHAQTGFYLYGNNVVVSGLFWNCDVGVFAETAEISLSAEMCAVDVPFDSSPYGSVSYSVTMCQDSDSDGMPDVWEQICGLNPTVDDAEEDMDGDLLSNWAEYFWWGTDPGDTHSLSATRNDGEFHLTAVAGEGGTRASLTVDQATYDSGTDPTSLQFTVAGALGDEFHGLYLYESGGQFWRNLFATYSGTFPEGDRYQASAMGDRTSATFAALSRYNDDSDGLEDGYEVKMIQTVVGNADSPSSIPGGSVAAANGITDGDEDLDGDGMSNLKEFAMGLNPIVAEDYVSDGDGDGLPDWAEDLIWFYLGITNPGLRDDSDGDGVDNYTELAALTDPSFPDAVYADFSSLPDAQRAFTLAPITVQHTASSDPDSLNDFIFDNAGTLGSYLHVEVRRDEDEVGNPLTGHDTLLIGGAFLSPPSGMFMDMLVDGEEPGDAYIAWDELLANATSLLAGVWEEAQVSDLIDQLSLETLVVIRQRSMLRTVIHLRELQLSVDLQDPSSGTQVRLRAKLSRIHTEAVLFRHTSARIAQIQGQNWGTQAGRWLSAGGRVATVFSVITSGRQVWDAAKPYIFDVRRRCDNNFDTAADLAVELGNLASNFASSFNLIPFWSIYWNQLSEFDGYDSQCF